MNDADHAISLTHYEAALAHFALGHHIHLNGGYTSDEAHNVMIRACESAQSKLVEPFGEFVVLA